MTLKILIALFTLSILQSGIAQNPYELSWKKDGTILGTAVGGQLAAIYLFANNDRLTIEDVNSLDKNDIWPSFDKVATGYNSTAARFSSDVLLYTSLGAPFLYLMDKEAKSGFLEIGVMTAEVFFVNAVTTSFAKEFSKRTRPYAYNLEVDNEEKTKLHARLSFYSGHTSTVAAMTFFSAKVFNDYYPKSKWKPVIWSIAALYPAATGYLRVAGGQHFPTDVITGYVAGGLIGYFIPHFHKKKDKTDKVGFSIYPGINSVGFTMTW